MTDRRLPEAPQRTQCVQPFDHAPYLDSHRVRRAVRLEKTGKNPDLCNKFATHEIDGVCLCRRHAADRALEKLCPPLRPTV